MDGISHQRSPEDHFSTTGYWLDVSTSSSFSSYLRGYQDLDVGNVTSKPLPGWTPATFYFYQVRAYNGNGTSVNSNRDQG